ncbi:hypothetical protein [Novosphingobium sp. 9U]|uniref:hypothetical protein n=1 Tax=Novosphingobium sp. 9U TaxID=2653158 RepID=UPI0012F16966|nr:hypothetical protein [Novosphingobium sp. 9U]VWX51055.1 conserved hypothetical protein [Novosphingobium sp. 9U]
MTQQVLERWMPSNIAELRKALDDIMHYVGSEGGDMDTVYVDLRDLALVREMLTDGSIAFNIVVRQNR